MGGQYDNGCSRKRYQYEELKIFTVNRPLGRTRTIVECLYFKLTGLLNLVRCFTEWGVVW